MPWTTWMKNRQARLSAAAVLLGAVSFWLAHRYLQAQELAAQQRLTAQYQTREVVAMTTLNSEALLVGPPRRAARARSRALEIEYIIGGTGAAAPRRAALRHQGQGEQP